MKINKCPIVWIVVFALSGCTGKILVSSISKDKLTSNTDSLNGIPFFIPSLFNEESRLTTLVDEKGNTIGGETKSGKEQCMPVILNKIVPKLDYEHPKIISYDHGYLEAYTFTVAITPEGGLASVNSIANPDRGQTLANVATAVGAIAKAAASSGVPNCNAGAVTTSLSRYNTP